MGRVLRGGSDVRRRTSDVRNSGLGLVLALVLVAPAAGQATENEAAPRPGTSADRQTRWEDRLESTHAVRVITAEEIWRSNARNLPDLLAEEFGIWMNYANYASGVAVSRGVSRNDVLILLDGLKMNNTATRFGTFEYLSTIDLHMLDRIELVRGAAGLYGGDTAGPVIRLFTKRDAAPMVPGPATGDASPEPPVARATYRYDTVDKSSIAHLEAHQEQERYSFLFGLTTRDLGDLKAGGDVGFQRVTAYEELSGYGRIQYFLSDTQTLDIDAQILEQQNVPQFDRVEDGSYIDFRLNPRKRTLFKISYLDRTDRSWTDDIEAFVYLNQQRQRAFRQFSAMPESSFQTSDNDDVEGLSARFAKQMSDRWRISYGAEYYDESVSAVQRELDTLTDEELERGKDPRRDGMSREQITLWAEDRYIPVETLAFSFGLRYSTVSIAGEQFTSLGSIPIDLDDDGFSWHLGGVWSATESLRVFASYDQGFRLPGIDEVTGQTPDETLQSLPNSSLTSQSSDAFELGLRYGNERFWGSISIFQTELQDVSLLLPAVDPSGELVGPSFVRTQSVGRAEIDGLELELDASLPANLHFSLSYVTTEGDDTRLGAPLSGVPPDFGAVGLRWEGPWAWAPWAEGMVFFGDEKDRLSPAELTDPDFDPVSLDSYSIFELRAGVTLPPRLRLVMTLGNQSEKAYKRFGSEIYSPSRSLALTAEYVF